MRLTLLLALFAAGCSRDQGFVAAPAVHVVVDSPTYGEFVGYGPIEVRGHVTPVDATVKVEGEDVAVDHDGAFTATVGWADRYRIVDVEGASGGSYERVRVPVFDGQDPMLAFPGGVTARLTPEGLEKLGEGVGGMIDGMGWDAQIASALPSMDAGWLVMTPTGLTHSPTTVDLTPAIGGIDTAIDFHDVQIGYDATLDVFGTSYTAPVTVTFGKIAIGALAVPDVDQDGMLSLTLTDSTISLDDPVIAVDGLDSWLVDLVVGAVADWIVEPLGELLLDVVLSQFGTIDLGGPYAFSQDLMGVSLDARLDDVYGDLDGLGLGLGVGIDAPAPDTVDVPAPGSAYDDEPVHLALGLHEGLLQAFLDTGLLDMMKQDMQLQGSMADLLGGGIANLPGGSDVPANDGWCVSTDPGTARVVRLQSGTAPLAYLYLPDFQVHIGYLDYKGCEPWLDASLAAKVGLRVTDGTKIGVSVDFVEGAVLSYGAPQEDWDEKDVVDGLINFLGGFTYLLTSQISFDLADLAGMGGSSSGTDPFGGLLGDVQPQIVGSTQIVGTDGQPIDGYYAVQMRLWE